MRCNSCNTNLSDYESTRKYMDGTYVDLCNKCWISSQMFLDNLPVIEREDLEHGESDWENSLSELCNER